MSHVHIRWRQEMLKRKAKSRPVLKLMRLPRSIDLSFQVLIQTIKASVWICFQENETHAWKQLDSLNQTSPKSSLLFAIFFPMKFILSKNFYVYATSAFKSQSLTRHGWTRTRQSVASKLLFPTTYDEWRNIKDFFLTPENISVINNFSV